MNEATAVTTRAGWLERFVEHDRFRSAVLALIVLSAILLGVETSRALPEAVSDFVVLLNRVILYIFVIEIVLRIAVYRLNFFRDSWSLFDFTIGDGAER